MSIKSPHIRNTRESCVDGCTEDSIVADSLADDTMREELWADWVARQKNGQNPDEITSEALGGAYRAMLERQHSIGPKNR